MLSSLMMLLLSISSAHETAGDPPYKLGACLDRNVSLVQRVACESPSGRGSLKDVEIWLAVPKTNERQTIGNLKFTPEPSRMQQDRHGNTYAVFSVPKVASGRNVAVGWSARIKARSISHSVDPRRLGRLSEIPAAIRKKYLADGSIYDLRNPELRAAAAKAGRGARNSFDLAFRINEFVRERLRYLNDGKWEAASNVLRNGHGSCSEYNFLYMALCRLNNLPARFVGASALRGTKEVYTDTVHHRWTEVYLPGYGWFPVDVSRNDGEDGAPVNRYFGATSEKLLITIKGDGGRNMPLEWGYVARINSKSIGDAKLYPSKSFTWKRVKDSPDLTRRSD